MRHEVAPSCSSVLVRAAALAAVGGFPEDYAYAEDIDTWLRLACHGRFYFIADVLSAIDAHLPGTLTRTAAPVERIAGLQRLMERFAALEREGKLPAGRTSAWRAFMLHQRGRLAVYLARAGRRGAALRALAPVPVNAHTWRDWGRCLAHVLRPRARR
jgi:GT2 family glycosyltransferase